jgi:hypothetical protein
VPPQLARRRGALGLLLGVVAAAPASAWLWGFTVDDALITGRVAAHVFRGIGHRFNPGGPVVDAVTPLGFAYALAPFSRGEPLVAMYFAKWLGVGAWLASAGWLGARITAEGGRGARFVVLLPLSLCAPLAAWAVSGMETGIVVGLATAALLGQRLAPVAGALAAAWRPELIPWALTLASGRALASGRGSTGVARAAAITAAGPVAVALVRLAVFGHAVPLAVWAKPSDFAHGAYYVAAALLWTGAPLLVSAPVAIRRLDGESRAILVAALAHCGALVLAGGDWMALFRLFVPVLPGLFLVGSRLVTVAAPWASALRALLATAVCATLLFDKGRVARAVGSQRLELVRRARPLLAPARRVAALDVGWVGAATSSDVVDLAGVTDESVARLPGGHTSKRLPPFFLEQRGVDTVVLLVEGDVPRADLPRARWARAVEARVAREAADLGFVLRAVLEVRGTAQSYVVLGLQNRP